ncbi:fam-a protein [Plasmodium yoelii]|uniref:Fam-a protein n=1 Tax=Plasmodium yoelii TaxID=5861 RepID=A0A4V0KEX4_PLAYE|nr:fam-a protein [Plasmodium yoelii]VTZ71896.1 fam-a protein [Plasmodium yoelii]|eukprot:XP_034493353.1 fam-a protein [Plasmodium yoelii]
MNKFYIQIVFFLLIISLCVDNKTHETELAPEKYTMPQSKKYTKPKSKKYAKSKSTKRYLTSEEIYEKNKHLLRHTLIKKCEYTVDDPNKYNELVNMFWDPDSSDYLYAGSVKRKIVRVYSPNLVMIQQRSKSQLLRRQKYFYALAANFKISENKTIIVMASANINDHNRKNVKLFRNTIIENPNSFKADIDSEDDIRNGRLQKMFVNLNGYIVEKKNGRVYITYINSVDEYDSI